MNTHSQEQADKDNRPQEQIEQSSLRSTLHEKDLAKSKKALSKREIMEQLSKERFPWDE